MGTIGFHDWTQVQILEWATQGQGKVKVHNRFTLKFQSFSFSNRAALKRYVLLLSESINGRFFELSI